MRAIILTCLILTGCAATERLPEPGPEDCQLRGGAALTEGTASASGIGGIQADVRGGAYTRVGSCGDKDHVFGRTPNGFSCFGSEAWCTKALDNTPIPVSPAQLRQLLRRL